MKALIQLLAANGEALTVMRQVKLEISMGKLRLKEPTILCVHQGGTPAYIVLYGADGVAWLRVKTPVAEFGDTVLGCPYSLMGATFTAASHQTP